MKRINYFFLIVLTWTESIGIKWASLERNGEGAKRSMNFASFIYLQLSGAEGEGCSSCRDIEKCHSSTTHRSGEISEMHTHKSGKFSENYTHKSRNEFLQNTIPMNPENLKD